MQHTPDTESNPSLMDFFIPFTKRKALFVLIVIGFVVYCNTLFNGFVLDDLFQIVNNAYLRSSMFYYFTHEIGPYYRPLMLTTFAIFYTFVGAQPFFYHLWQISLHISNAFLLYLLFLTFFQNKKLTLFLSIVFLVHPINSETIDYASILQDVYFVFFGLLSIVLIRTQHKSINTFILSSFLLFFSLLSKETGLLFILLQTCIIYLFDKKWLKIQLFSSALVITGYILLKLLLVGHLFNQSGFLVSINNTVISAPLSQRLINIPQIFLFYLKTFIFPLDLAVSQYWWNETITFSHYFLPLAVDIIILLLFTLIGFYIFKKNYKNFLVYIFFLGWFLLGVSFHLQIIKLDGTIAEHWFYAPEIGLLGTIGVIYETFVFKVSKYSSIITSMCIILLIILGIRTYIRNTNWYSPLTLYTHDIAISNSTDLEYNLGLAYGTDGNYQLAVKYLKESLINIKNGYYPWQNLGLDYLNMHDYKDASYAFKKAIIIDPTSESSYEYMVIANLLGKKPNVAVSLLKGTILKKWPDDAEEWHLLGLTDVLLKDRKNALSAFKMAYKLNPTQQDGYAVFNIQNNLPIKLSL